MINIKNFRAALNKQSISKVVKFIYVKSKELMLRFCFSASLLFIITLWIFLHPSKELIESSPRQIVTIDINNILNTFIRNNRESEKSEEAINKLVDAFTNKLSIYIETKANNDHLTIIPKQAVLAGGKDITELVKKDLFKDK